MSHNSLFKQFSTTVSVYNLLLSNIISPMFKQTVYLAYTLIIYYEILNHKSTGFNIKSLICSGDFTK